MITWSGSIQYETLNILVKQKTEKKLVPNVETNKSTHLQTIVLLTKSRKCLLSVYLNCVKRTDWCKDKLITNDPQPTHPHYCCTYIYPTNLFRRCKHSSISPTFLLEYQHIVIVNSNYFMMAHSSTNVQDYSLRHHMTES